jgi:hypothetical protein
LDVETTKEDEILKCKKCNDTGWFQYDHNHSTVCNACCKHDKGFWLLTEHYGNAGKWCCMGGCGKILTYSELKEKLLAESDHYPVIMKIQEK